jgi:hypothetical protein
VIISGPRYYWSMTPLIPEAAGTLFREYSAWFGPPALLRKHPAQFSFDQSLLSEQETYIIDGAVRFRTLAAQGLRGIWTDERLPFLVFPIENIYSTEGRKLLPRQLVLAGHYDRAAKYVPEQWSHTPQDVAAFLNVSMLEALQVTAAMREQRRRAVRHVQFRKRDCLEIVNAITRRLVERAEGERDFTLPELAKLVHYDGPV